MDTLKLTEILTGYGADIDGLTRRFCGDLVLYQKCLNDFFKEKEFEQLETAMANNDYASAFAPAHTIKGLSGNLGLTPLYKSACVLVESLRNKKYDNIVSEYNEVIIQQDVLKALLPDSNS